MKEYISSYEKDLQNSTELVDEQQKPLVNEDLKNFWKSDKTKENQLKRTVISVCTKYNLRQLKIDGKINPNVRGKREGDYNIRLFMSGTQKGKGFLWMHGISKEMVLYITDADSDQPLEDMTHYYKMDVKYDWSEEDLVETINDCLTDYGIVLTTGNSPIKPPKKEESSSKENDKKEEEKEEKVSKDYGDIPKKEIVQMFNDSNLSDKQQMLVVKKCLSGWQKISDDEVLEFKKLLNVK